MKEQKKKSNKQWRREIIADVNRREAERKREKWHVRICWISIFAVGLVPGSVTALIGVLKLDNNTVTFTNISLGLITITGSTCLAGIIGLYAIWKLFPNISLKNDGSLKDVPLPEYLIPPTGDIHSRGLMISRLLSSMMVFLLELLDSLFSLSYSLFWLHM